ncbi:MAG: sigma-54 dependent transcriptional regulator [Deltaproteobacteria bacterium]
MELTKILIVEDSQPTRDYLTELVQILGFQAHPVMQKTHFLTDLNRHNPDLLLLGSCSNPGQMKAFAKVVELEKNCLPIIYITDGSDGDERELEKLLPGENTCLLPVSFNPDQLKHAIRRMVQESKDSDYAKLNETIVGESSAIAEIRQNVLRLSKSDVTVLITGESGTGKELVAKAIHDCSPRAKKPFIKVNSAALPDNLIESELFGYEKGAFTGAWRSKPGKFLLAHGGTLLLDEIGEISLHLQPKLLQVLEDDEIPALGSTTNSKIDVRVLASTNSDLRREVTNDRFRADLYYRLNVVSIHLPPLRERTEDIRPLCKHFLKKHVALNGINGQGDIEINNRTLEHLYRYPWPGNVRELENNLKSFFVLGDEESFLAKLRNRTFLTDYTKNLVPAQPSPLSTGYYDKSASSLSLKEATKEATRKAETDAILDVLSYTRWNRRKTASLLKISYKALLNKIKEYELEDRYRQLVRGQSPADSRHQTAGSRSTSSGQAGSGQAGSGLSAAGSKYVGG